MKVVTLPQKFNKEVSWQMQEEKLVVADMQASTQLWT